MKFTSRSAPQKRSKTALGVLIALGVASQATAEDANDLVQASALEGVVEVRQLPDGSVELVFASGDVVTLSADQVSIDDGQILISADTLAGLADAGAFNFLGGGTLPILIGAGVIGAGIGLGFGLTGTDIEDDVVEEPAVDPLAGTAGADTITGTAGADTIDGLAGDDTIDGAGGDDTLIGGAGDDTLIGSAGADSLVGGAGDDTLVVDADDTVDGGEGLDTVDLSGFDAGVVVDLDVETPGGEDSQNGGILTAPIPAGGEIITPLTDVENVIGTEFNDVIFGNNEVNILDGGAGDDTFHSFAGADTINGGDGSDTVLFTAGPAVEVNLDANGDATTTVLLDTPVAGDVLTGIENLTGSATGDDILSGNDEANILNGNGGADTLNGEGGDDTIISDALDTIDGGAGTDTVDFSGAAEAIIIDLDIATPGGEDSQDGGLLDAAPAAGGQVTLEVDDVENVIGTAFDDIIFGNNEINVLDGGAGDDLFHSFGGADTIFGGDGVDTVLFTAGPAVEVNLDDNGDATATVLLETPVEGDTLVGVENLVGSASGDDILSGNDSDNVLNGNGGADTLNGEGGDDTIISDALDTIDGGAGTDTVDFSVAAAGIIIDLDVATPGGEDSQDGGLLDAAPAAGGQVTLEVDDVENVIGTGFDDIIFGNNEINLLEGGAGDDVFHSFGGADTVDGGEGSDTVLFSATPAGVTVTLDEDGNGTATIGDTVSDTLISIENVTGSGVGDDVLTGNSGVNVLNGLGGDDVLATGGGLDTLIGGDGVDTADFSAVTDGIAVSLEDGAFGEVNVLEDGTNDISGSGAEPTLFALSEGVSRISNQVVNAAGGADFAPQDVDIFTITIPEGSELTAVFLSEFISTDNVGFLAVVEGDTFPADALAGDADPSTFIGLANFGNEAFPNATSGSNILEALAAGGGLLPDTAFAGFPTDDATLPAGTFTFLVQQLGGATIDFSLDFVVAAADEELGDAFGSIDGVENVIGTSAGDVIVGDAADNILTGLAGNDTLTGGAGDDILVGGGGVDIIAGGDGIDTNSFEGIGLGVTATLAADGTGTAVYGSVSESFTGIENLIGTSNDDVLIATGAAANTISGGDGDDLIAGGGGTDILDGGAGIDTNSFQGIGIGVTASLADGTAVYGGVSETFTNFENLTGTDFADNLTGDDGDNVLTGGAGGDTLTGGAGDDILVGGGGVDIIAGGDGIDTNSFEGIGLGVTATLAADGTGTAVYGGVNESFTGIENLIGTSNDDVLIATGAANNTISGGDGDDLIAGGGGTDILDGGAGIDTNSFQGIGAGVTASLADGTAVYGGVSETFTNFENLTGSSNDDDLTGDDGANVLDGALGDDTLTGGAGADTFVTADGGGADTVTDFAVADDVIDVTGHGLTAAEALALATDDGSGNTLIDFGDGDTVTLTGVAAADLTADNFEGTDAAVTGTAFASAAVIDLSDLSETDINDQLAAGNSVSVSGLDAFSQFTGAGAADFGGLFFAEDLVPGDSFATLPASDAGDSL